MVNYKDIYKELRKLRGAKVLLNEPLSNHTTLRIGGPASILVIPRDAFTVQEIIRITPGIKKYVIGNGSNILMPDIGLKGLVIKVSGCLNDFSCEGRSVTLGAGTLIQPLIRRLAKMDLSGLEFASGVPAALGGSIIMNMGAFGHELGKMVDHVQVVTRNGRIEKLSRGDLHFSYRSTDLEDCILLSAKLKLSYKPKKTIISNINKVLEKRKETQPWSVPSAGSVFKNPKEIPAGKLIDMAGLKGLRIGGAEISKKHANFIINLGDARSCDVKAIIKKVKTAVKEKFKINMELELVDSSKLTMLF